MDRFSHVELAKGLLRISNENINVSYMSILPLVDGAPSFLHRLHCHPLSKASTVVDAAKVVFGYEGDHIPQISEDVFELKRFRQEKHQFIEVFNKLVKGYTNKGMEVSVGYGPLLSVISHTYFDTFNNAVQAFTPYESYCAGQYDMWHEIDYFNYRIKWYQETAPQVRQKVLEEKFWNDYSFTSKEMVKGMIDRIAHYTQPSVSKSTIKKVENDLAVDDISLNPEVREFYVKLETSLRKHLKDSVSNSEEVTVSI
ncbi:hypothetical protein SAMN05421676_10596 [Salinibacillus kushneri]|uniref:Uncharacterized protein n=1 Tax=Salinibacillus kushneri TaxID=237682 RepID=A0A1I0EX35_9BACI|nr:hypothetical protein [Salinibacillus kushneri]SET49481.1 hypothetical protein SAMN05421676_10596 [Salinibacillus kushneri]